MPRITAPSGSILSVAAGLAGAAIVIALLSGTASTRFQHNLGQFAFRPPVSAYKHSAAQFLKLRGWISSDTPHPQAFRRPESDIEILQNILTQLTTFNL